MYCGQCATKIQELIQSAVDVHGMGSLCVCTCPWSEHRIAFLQVSKDGRRSKEEKGEDQIKNNLPRAAFLQAD
mgnify:CR=1 FL=1